MTFLEKYELLKKSIPVPAVENDTQSVGCEYSDGMIASKNCFYCEGLKQEDCIYAILSGYSTNIADCLHTHQSEKCYACVACSKCHSSTYLFDCNNSTDCHYSALLNSCSDCTGCVGLTHKKYCIFNKQFSEGEYKKRVEELKMEKPEILLAQMIDLKQKIPHQASTQFNSENCPYGDYIYDSKNCYWVFNSLSNENSGYAFDTTGLLNCWDMYRGGGAPGNGQKSERCYEMFFSRFNYECAYLNHSDKCTNCIYGDWLTNCNDCFGCIGLKSKKYCILNNQLTKEQYEKTVKGIKKELGWKI